MDDVVLLDALATVLAYPDEATAGHLARARERLAAEAPELADRLAPLAATLAGEPTEAEELYTRTFDVSPLCSLEVGWHLFGEDYARGTFLVRMRETLRALDVEESTELPDHLSHVLAAVARLDPDGARALACEYAGPALARMLERFDEPENPYHVALEVVAAWLRRRYGAPVAVPHAGSGLAPSPYASACGGCAVASIPGAGGTPPAPTERETDHG